MSDLWDQVAAGSVAPQGGDLWGQVQSGQFQAPISQDSAPQSGALDSWIGRPLGLAGRAVATGVSALPLMAMDSGVALRNIIGDWGRKELGWEPTPDYQLPSQEFQDALTEAGFPTPKTPIEKGTSFIESTLSGLKTPMPEEGGGVPDNFQSSDQALLARRLQGVKNGMESGYRVPPATTNPNLINQGLETVAGKIATQQAAAHLNQPVTNRLAAEALGLDPDVPISQELLHSIRAGASADYGAISKVGSINLDQQFKDAISGIVGKFNKTAQEVPSLANKDLAPVADDLGSKDSLSGDALLGAIRGLRNKAEMAFRAGDGSSGAAYKSMAAELENAADRDLSSRGPEYGDLVNNFKQARQKIAIAHTIEDALNPGTGNVLAPKLAAALRRGEPLSGPLRTIAEFASSVPKAVQEPTTSPVSHLNLVGEILGGMGGAAAHGPIGAAIGATAYPAARMGARGFLMGPGQNFAIPAEELARLPWWARVAPATYESSVAQGGSQ